MLKQKVKTEWLLLGVFLAVAFLLGIKGVYAYLDIISFTGGTYQIGNENHNICPDLVPVNVNNSNSDKLDRCTGLRWKASDETGGPYNWYQAAGVSNSIYNSPVINKCPSGYRLPTIEELYSLVNLESFSTNTNLRTNSSPLIAPSNIALGTYWSATKYTLNANYARSVAFWQGTADNIIYSKSTSLNVRCISTTVCGDGVLASVDEACDGSKFPSGGGTCESQGFAGGVLSCHQCTVQLDGCFNSVIKPSVAGQSCDAVCAQYRINEKGVVCNADACGGAQLECKSIGTYQGYCLKPGETTGTQSCNSDDDCTIAGATCLVGALPDPLNSAWKQSVLNGANFACKNIKGHCGTDFSKPCLIDGDCGGGSGSCTFPDKFNPPVDPCALTMGGYGDVCDGRKTPWAYCQCGTKD
jgi:hypothetical protein